ncbi:MAG: TRAP transporter substrate-binding protein [Bacteroidota bacterium]
MQIKMLKKLSILIGFVVFVTVFSSCFSDKKKKVIKLAHSLDQTHSVHRAMVYMAERLAEKSNGKLTIQIYPGGQLGSERGALELLQIGSIGITKVSAAVMEGFVDEFKVLGLPYLFENKEHLFAVLDGQVGEKLLKTGEDIWLRGLCFYDAGSRSFYTKDKPIRKPADLNGLKIRVMKSISAMNMVEALGGSPTPISWGELYTALQSGVVEGAENNPPSFYLSHHYEVCKYYSLDEHTTVPDIVLISKIVWDKLSEQEQKWLQEAADESAVYQRKLWAESEKESLKAVKDAGIEIIYPDKSKFSDMVQPLYDDLLTDPKMSELVKTIKSQVPKDKPVNNEN